METKEITRLEQRKFNKGRSVFVLRDNGTLLYTFTHGANVQHLEIDLSGFSPESNHSKKQSRVSRAILKLAFVLMCAPVVIVILALPFAPMKSVLPILSMSLIFGFMWLIMRSVHDTHYFDWIIFRKPMTGGQIVFYNNLPNEKTFADFISALTTEIKKYPAVRINKESTMSAELREFARLRDEGVLTNEEFEEAKRKLLMKINASSDIGFHA